MIEDRATRGGADVLVAILRRILRGMDLLPEAACCHETGCVQQDLGAALDALAGLREAIEEAQPNSKRMAVVAGFDARD